MNRMDAEIAAEFKNLNAKLDSALVTLYGSEETGQPGLRIRVDRIEQKQAARDESETRAAGIRYAIIGTLLALIGDAIKRYFFGSHGK